MAALSEANSFDLTCIRGGSFDSAGICSDGPSAGRRIFRSQLPGFACSVVFAGGTHRRLVDGCAEMVWTWNTHEETRSHLYYDVCALGDDDVFSHDSAENSWRLGEAPLLQFRDGLPRRHEDTKEKQSD